MKMILILASLVCTALTTTAAPPALELVWQRDYYPDFLWSQALLSPDGSTIYAMQYESIQEIDTETGEVGELYFTDGQTKDYQILDMKMRQGGRYISTRRTSTGVQIWDTEEKSLLHNIKLMESENMDGTIHFNTVWGYDISLDMKYIYAIGIYREGIFGEHISTELLRYNIEEARLEQRQLLVNNFCTDIELIPGSGTVVVSQTLKRSVWQQDERYDQRLVTYSTENFQPVDTLYENLDMDRHHGARWIKLSQDGRLLVGDIGIEGSPNLINLNNNEVFNLPRRVDYEIYYDHEFFGDTGYSLISYENRVFFLDIDTKEIVSDDYDFFGANVSISEDLTKVLFDNGESITLYNAYPTGIENEADKNIRVNYREGSLLINSHDNIIADISISDVSGKVVYNKQLDIRETVSIPLKLIRGTYFVNIITGDLQETHQITVTG